MKLEKMRENPELRESAEAKIELMEKKNAEKEAMSSSEAEAKLLEILEMIDHDLSDGREFLVGNQYSMADIVATCLLARIHFGK